MEQARKRRRSGLAIATCLLATVVGMGLAESALRIFLQEEEANGNYWGIGAFEALAGAGYRHAPGFVGRAVRSRAFDVAIETNEWGLRQSDLSPQLVFPNKLLILGDSFAFGLGVAEEQAFPHLLQTRMNPLQIGVINGAQSGFSTRQEVAFGTYLSDHFHPQLILLCLFLDNDVDGDYYAMARPIEVKYGYRLPGDRFLRGDLADFLRTHSYLWMSLDGQLNRLRSRNQRRRFHRLARTERDRVLEPTLAALDELGSYCLAHGIHLTAAMIPPRQGDTGFEETVSAALRSRAIPLLALEAKDFGDEDYFARDGHWNAAGHRKFTRYLESFLEPQLRTEEPPRELSQPGLSYSP